MNNVIKLMQRKRLSPMPLRVNRIQGIKDADDILCDPEIHRMMQDWFSCGPYNSMCLVDGVYQESYAEQITLDPHDLRLYGANSPIALARSPYVDSKEGESGYLESGGIEDANVLLSNEHSRSMMKIMTAAWFFGLPVSCGTVAMLTSNENGGSDMAIRKSSLRRWVNAGRLVITNRKMVQPFQPDGVVFSPCQNRIIVPTRRTLYRAIEAVMQVQDSIRSMDYYDFTMNKWTSKNWPGINNPAGDAERVSNAT